MLSEIKYVFLCAFEKVIFSPDSIGGYLPNKTIYLSGEPSYSPFLLQSKHSVACKFCSTKAKLTTIYCLLWIT